MEEGEEEEAPTELGEEGLGVGEGEGGHWESLKFLVSEGGRGSRGRQVGKGIWAFYA